MPDDRVDAVENMIKWLYTRQLTSSSMATLESADTQYWYLARLNCLAEKYDILDLKHAVTDAFHDVFNLEGIGYSPRRATISYVYETKSHPSQLGNFLVAWCAWQLPMTWYAEASTRERLLEVPELSTDLVVALAARQLGATNPLLLPKSKFHEKAQTRVSEDVQGGGGKEGE